MRHLGPLVADNLDEGEARAMRPRPLLEKLGDNTGLRLAAPRIYRSARDLKRWIGALANADSIEASQSTTATTEELRVRIASK